MAVETTNIAPRGRGLCVRVDENGNPYLAHTDGEPVDGVQSLEISKCLDGLTVIKVEVWAARPEDTKPIKVEFVEGPDPRVIAAAIREHFQSSPDE